MLLSRLQCTLPFKTSRPGRHITAHPPATAARRMRDHGISRHAGQYLQTKKRAPWALRMALLLKHPAQIVNAQASTAAVSNTLRPGLTPPPAGAAACPRLKAHAQKTTASDTFYIFNKYTCLRISSRPRCPTPYETYLHVHIYGAMALTPAPNGSKIQSPY